MSIADKYEKMLEEAEDSIEYWAEGAVLDFTEGLARVMEQHDISRAELAKRVGTSPSYITKVFGGDANFTIETMTKFALAIDQVVRIHIAPKDTKTVWRDLYTNNNVQVAASKDDVIAVAQPDSEEFHWNLKVATGG